ncbi:alpha/beta hydrolase [Ahniella affigens]|nr:alpha/beta hydrolase [Ahniella affigens]
MSAGLVAIDAARTIVLIHGAGGGAFEWQIWQRVLAAHGWSVAVPTLEPAPSGLAATRYDDYLAQLRHAIAAIKTRPILIGASLGGLLAMELAADTDAAALVLINPMPPASDALGMLPEVDTPAIEAWADTASLESTARAVPDASPATWHWLWRQWRNESGAVLRDARVGRLVQRPTMPGLILISGADREVPAAASRTLAHAWQLEIMDLPTASHVGPLLGTSAADVALRVHHWLRFRLGTQGA